MMSFLIFWLVTIIGSYTISVKMVFNMIKDLADEGYKLNLDNLRKFSEEFNSSSISLNKIIYFIPFINILFSFKIVIDYNNSKWNILDQLRILDVLDTMTIEEKKKYDENPTTLNALIMLVDNNDTKVRISGEEIDEDFDKMLKVISEKTDISYEELKKKIKYEKKVEEQDNKSRIHEIQKEKEYLNNYKNEILESINNKEEVKVLKKTPDNKEQN